MAIVRRIPDELGVMVVTDTGIYKDIVFECTEDNWPAVRKQWPVDNRTSAELIDEATDRISEARRISFKDDRPHVRNVADKLGFVLQKMHIMLAANDIQGATYCAIIVGQLEERLRIQSAHEANAMSGKRFKLKSSKGTAKLKADTQMRYAAINTWIADKMKIKSKVSLTKRRQQAATEFGVSYDTVLDAQKTIRKK